MIAIEIVVVILVVCDYGHPMRVTDTADCTALTVSFRTKVAKPVPKKTRTAKDLAAEKPLNAAPENGRDAPNCRDC